MVGDPFLQNNSLVVGSIAKFLGDRTIFRFKRQIPDGDGRDDADDSLHLFVAIHDGGPTMPPTIPLTRARRKRNNRRLRRISP